MNEVKTVKETKVRLPGRLSPPWILLLAVLPLACMLFSMSVGRFYVPVGDIFASAANKLALSDALNAQTEAVLWSLRFPRILMALLVGAGLSAAGCVLQSLFSNPLATPDTLGVASGSGFGAALALLFGMNLIGVQVLALAFGMGAMALTWISGRGKNQRKVTIVLAGIIIGSLFSALISFVKFAADSESQLPSITYWLMGSLSSAGYGTIALGAPLIIAGIIVLFILRWRLNALPLSDDEARSIGVNIRALRITAVICSTAITAACVSMCGQVGWVGLLIPHICRMKFGSSHVALIPASVCCGGAFMILVDTAARTISASEIPVSILTAILGAPFFIILMKKTGGWDI